MSTRGSGKVSVHKLSMIVATVAIGVESLLAQGCLSVRRERAVSLAVTQKVEVLGGFAAEPMIVEHPLGALFVAGYGFKEAKLWKSVDHGSTWSRVDLGPEANGVLGNSDVDLAVARDGTLYFASMTFDITTNIGQRIAIGVSKDVGTTWSWTKLSETPGDDRPWVEVAPDGTAHVIWNDGKGVLHAVSRDRGATWTEGERVHDRGGSSHLAVGPHGEVAVRVTPASKSGSQFDQGVDLIAVSEDAGKSWRKHEAPGDRRWKSLEDERWVEPLAWDERGMLYSFWTVDRQLRLARSTDRGATWKEWQVGQSADPVFFPYLVARGDGELAATWFSRSGDALQWHAATLQVPHGAALPHTVESPALPTDSYSPGAKPGDPLRPVPGGEYLGATFLRDGGLAVVTPIGVSQERVGFTWWRLQAR